MLIDLVDKLADRAIQLLTLRKRQRKELLQDYVSPVFAEFELLHSAYLESFARYREAIQNIDERSWLQALRSTLERDNLFTAGSRSKVIQLAQAEPDESLRSFISEIRDYLLGARLVEPLGRDVFPNLVQRWRQGFTKTLDTIVDERWQLVIDPDGAGPLLSPVEIRAELDRRRVKYPISGAPPDALKRSCALWALDEVVWEMQSQYDRVCEAYAQLRRVLSK